MYQNILFDLDGTLTDSAPGIIRSVDYALEKLGQKVPEGTNMNAFIGPPLKVSFQTICGMSPDEAAHAVDVYRERYNTVGLFENRVYPGIMELLTRLKADGFTIGLATAKPEVTSVRIMEHFGLAPYFTVMAGASLDESRPQKADVIAYAMSRLPGANTGNTVMIGDRDQDALGAAQNGIPCIGVLYGYGSPEELTGAGASLLARDTDDLYRLLTAE